MNVSAIKCNGQAEEGDIAGIVHSLRRLVTDFTLSHQLINSAVSGAQLRRIEIIPRKVSASAPAKILPLRICKADQNSTASVP